MWSVIRRGAEVQICDDRGSTVATVGKSDDYRINARLNAANLMASAPEMLELLIDVQELFRREYFVDDHPILECISKRCTEVINKTMKLQGEIHESKLRAGSYSTRKYREAGITAELSGVDGDNSSEPSYEEVEHGGAAAFCAPLEIDGEEDGSY
jgi:hypothetical protein